MANDKDLATNLRIAATLLRHGHLLELAQSAYAGVQAAESYREKVGATHPLQLALADVADELTGKSLPRDFDETRDYLGEAERKLGDGKIISWLLKFAGIAANLQTFLDDLAGK